VCRSAKVPIGTSWLKLHFSSLLRTHRPLTVLQTNTIHRPKRNSDRHDDVQCAEGCCCAFRARFVIQFTDQTKQPAHEQHSIGIVLLTRDYTPLNGEAATVWSSQLGPPVQTLGHSIGADQTPIVRRNRRPDRPENPAKQDRPNGTYEAIYQAREQNWMMIKPMTIRAIWICACTHPARSAHKQSANNPCSRQISELIGYRL